MISIEGLDAVWLNGGFLRLTWPTSSRCLWRTSGPLLAIDGLAFWYKSTHLLAKINKDLRHMAPYYRPETASVRLLMDRIKKDHLQNLRHSCKKIGVAFCMVEGNMKYHAFNLQVSVKPNRHHRLVRTKFTSRLVLRGSPTLLFFI